MGTRGAWGFRIDGADKVTYNHWDSYPTGLGKVMMSFVQATPLPKLTEIAKRITLVEEKSTPTTAQIEHYKKVADTSVGEQKLTDWYCLLRGLQFHPEAYHKKAYKHMIDSHLFLRESLWCEWAYIINLDTKKLEVYEGGNRHDVKPHHFTGETRSVNKSGRYWDLGKYEASGGAYYYGVALIAELDLAEVRGMTEAQIEAKCKELEKVEE